MSIVIPDKDVNVIRVMTCFLLTVRRETYPNLIINQPSMRDKKGHNNNNNNNDLLYDATSTHLFAKV